MPSVDMGSAHSSQAKMRVMSLFAASGRVQTSARMRSSFVPQRHFESASCPRRMVVFELLARPETRTTTGGFAQIQAVESGEVCVVTV